MKKLIILSGLVILFITACTNNATLNEDTATEIISDYLKSNPEYKSTRINLGEIKFKNKNDKKELLKYKDLENKGYIEMTLQDQKKKFLSKDSVYFYLLTLTDMSKPYILKQEQNKATIRVIDYILDEEKPVNLINSGNKTAKVTVILKKVKNAFTVFYNDENTGSNFITKTFKLKFKKEAGWKIVK